jgi:hypothetical protein
MDTRTFVRTRDEAAACSAAEDWAAAAPLWARVVEDNPLDGRGWDRLAEARLALGEYEAALGALVELERIGLYESDRIATFPGVTSYLIACCHTGLGNTDAAVAALADMMARGFTHFEELLADDRLGALRDDPRFARVLGLEDVDDLGRDEGWRTDLRVLVREAHRRRPVTFEPAVADELTRRAERLSEDIPSLTDAQIVLRLTELLVLLDDGHAGLTVPPERDDLAIALPVQFYLFADGVHVTSATEAHRGILGAEVLAFDGRAVEAVVAAVEPLVCRDHEVRPIEVVPSWLRRTPFLHALGLVDDPANVTLTTRDGTVEVRAEPDDGSRSDFPTSARMVQCHDDLDEPPLYLRDPGAAYWFDVLPDQRLMYVQFNSVRDDPTESLAAFADRLADRLDAGDVDRLVFDLRWNSGGNTFLVAPLLRRIAGCRRLDRPGGLFLVVGRRTFSAAGNTAKLFEWLGGRNLTIVGEPTGSKPKFIGETVPFKLPYSGLRCNISNLAWQGITPYDLRSWIAPDIYTPPTFASYRDGHDPAMDAILQMVGDEAR